MFNNALYLAASGGNPIISLVFMGVLLIGLFLIMILPQKKREKQMKQMLDSLRPGTRIRTIGGIYGTIVTVKEDLVTIVTGPDDVRLVFVKGAIATIEDAQTDTSVPAENTESEAAENTDNTDN